MNQQSDSQMPKACPDAEDNLTKKELSDGKDNISSFLPLTSSFDNVSSFDELDALFEPAALSAPRALSALDKGAGKGGRLSPKEEPSPGQGAQSTGQRAQTSGQGAQKDFEINKTPEKSSNDHTQEKHSGTGIKITNEDPVVKDNTQKDKPENETSGPETTGEINSKEENRAAELREQSSEVPDKTENEIPDDETPDIAQPPQIEEDPGTGLPDPGDPELPKCLQIIKKVCSGSDLSGGRNLTFTFDEIRFLAADPVFNHLDPKMAAEMRRLSHQIDSG